MIPQHLQVMRSITGVHEVPGDKDNPMILGWVNTIVQRYPSMKGTVGWYNHDSIPWCGLGLAYCLVMANLPPPKKALSALAWRDEWPDGISLMTPCRGAVGVMVRTGGGHVTMYEGEDATGWFGRGCNQNDAVNVEHIPWDRKVWWMWPKSLVLQDPSRFHTSMAAINASKET